MTSRTGKGFGTASARSSRPGRLTGLKRSTLPSWTGTGTGRIRAMSMPAAVASKPGIASATRTGTRRLSWRPRTCMSGMRRGLELIVASGRGSVPMPMCGRSRRLDCSSVGLRIAVTALAALPSVRPTLLVDYIYEASVVVD